MQPRSVHATDHEEEVRAFDSKPDEGAASQPVSSTPRKKVV
jgi:hypothetical protein